MVQAKFRDIDIPEFDKNPLIAAMSERVSPKRFKEIMERIIPCPEFDGLDVRAREIGIRKLRNSYIFTRAHLDCYLGLYQMIEYGYQYRNPVKPEVVSYSYDLADPDIPVSDLKQREDDSWSANTTADAMIVTGYSGNGKSRLMKGLLHYFFDQLIEHENEGFQDAQIVYLYVDIPHGASRTGLMASILEALDNAMSKSFFGPTNYLDSVQTKSGRYITTDAMMRVLLKALNRHHVGVLIIDEFQNIGVLSDSNRQQVLQLFDELSNRVMVPTLKIGTPDCLSLFSKHSRHLRRLGVPLELQPLSDKAWDKAMEQIFLFQPLKKPIPKTDSIEQLLKSYSAGVPAYLFGLWEACLIEAMRTGTEKITQNLIKSVFKQRYPLLRSVIRSIEKGNYGKYQDIFSVQQYLDSGNTNGALKMLSRLVSGGDIKGSAAQELLDGIEGSIDAHDFSESDLKKLDKIMAELDAKRAEALGPQTLEHDGGKK